MPGLSPFELLGWIGAALTVAAFAAKTMLPLRLTAMAASIVFIAYGAATGAVALVALHAAILPFNGYRLLQLLRADRSATGAREGEFTLDWIKSTMKAVKFADGEVLFRKGDPPHYIYFLKSGKVLLEEIDLTLEEGEIVGEIAFFSEAHERTLTARCVGPCEIIALREKDFTRFHYQNPALGIYVLKLVATRLLEGVEKHPEAYRRISALERKRREGGYPQD